MPSAPGDYRYSVEYRQDGKSSVSTGTFQATDGHRRGLIRVDSQHRWHFIWEGIGEHYFFNGTTAFWLIGWTDEKVIRDSIQRLHDLEVNRIRVTIAGRTNLLYGEPIMTGPNWTTFVTAWPAKEADDIHHPGFDYTSGNKHLAGFRRRLDERPRRRHHDDAQGIRPYDRFLYEFRMVVDRASRRISE
jgi:hypothetical protein